MPTEMPVIGPTLFWAIKATKKAAQTRRKKRKKTENIPQS
jgi:hypothetical protein